MCQNTLCQHHLQAIPAMQNRELQWVRYQVVLDELPNWQEADSVLNAPTDSSGFYLRPAWLSLTDLPSNTAQLSHHHNDLDYLQQVPF
jgi:hypothetical protein